LKKKYLNIILFAIVAVIWARVFFKFKKQLIVNPVKINNNIDKKNFILQKKEFSIYYPERDPFLGNIKIEDKKYIPPKSKFNPAKKTTVNNKIYHINYYGFIQKKNYTTSKLAIISFNDKIYYLKKNQVVNNLKLDKILRDSIIFLNPDKHILIIRRRNKNK